MSKEKIKNTNSVLLKILTCTAVSLLAKSLLVLLSSYIISSSETDIEKLYFYWFIISAISALIAGLFAGRIFKQRGIIWGSLTGIIGAVLLLIFLCLFCGFNVSINIFLLIPCEIIVSAVGGIISSNLK